MSSNQKVCLFGGTFNPIHIGHIELAKAAYFQLNLDQIMWIPSGISYFKDQKEILSSKDRCKMVQIGIKEYPFMDISSVEIERVGNSYFYETLQYFKKKNPNTIFYFLLGADCLFQILEWKNYEFIFENCILVTAIRDHILKEDLQTQCDLLKEKHNAKIEILDFKEIDISSTQIRNELKNGDKQSQCLTKEVLNYILTNNLFKEGTLEYEKL